MPIAVNIHGVIAPQAEARISVLDHGLLFGDSVYETLRTYRRKPFLFSRHFARLEHSAAGIALRLPWTKEKTIQEIVRTLESFFGERENTKETRIRLVVTRGVGDITADPETCSGPTVIIIVTELVELQEGIYTDGVNVAISRLRQAAPFAGIKTGSLIHQVLARREASSRNAFEAILLTGEGCLSDGITSNIYLVRDGRLMTPSYEAGIVEGITRGAVLDLAREIGLSVKEGVFPAADIDRAEEMFLTSTTREVVPITSVDGKPVGDGRPGPITLRLLSAYRSAIERLTEED